MSEFMGSFYTLPFFDLTVTLLNVVIACECSLFLAFDFDLNKCACKRLSNIDKNFTVDQITRLVKGVLSLNLNFSFREVATWITKEKHMYLNKYSEFLIGFWGFG